MPAFRESTGLFLGLSKNVASATGGHIRPPLPLSFRDSIYAPPLLPSSSNVHLSNTAYRLTEPRPFTSLQRVQSVSLHRMSDWLSSLAFRLPFFTDARPGPAPSVSHPVTFTPQDRYPRQGFSLTYAYAPRPLFMQLIRSPVGLQSLFASISSTSFILASITGYASTEYSAFFSSEHSAVPLAPFTSLSSHRLHGRPGQATLPIQHPLLHIFLHLGTDIVFSGPLWTLTHCLFTYICVYTRTAAKEVSMYI